MDAVKDTVNTHTVSDITVESRGEHDAVVKFRCLDCKASVTVNTSSPVERGEAQLMRDALELHKSEADRPFKPGFSRGEARDG